MSTRAAHHRLPITGVLVLSALVLVAVACGSSTPAATGTTSVPATAVAGGATTAPATTRGTAPTPVAVGTGVARAAAQTTRSVAYATASPSETLDLYLPASDGSRAVPVVVLIHGGAFQSGDASMEATLAQALVEQGFAVAAVDYRLSGEAPYPAGAQDVKAAVRWLRANAATYGLDAARFAAFGQSAGGWMANMLGATGDQATLFDDPALGHADQSAAVQAVVSWYGPSDFATMDEQAKAVTACGAASQVHGVASSPESLWLGEAVATSSKTASTDIASYLATATSIPPWYLAHGDADCNVPGGQSLELDQALAAAGVQATYVVLPGARHADPAFDRTQTQPTIEFLKTALGG